MEDKGLAYRIDLPDTSYANDLKVLIGRKDITEMSFGVDLGTDFRLPRPVTGASS